MHQPAAATPLTLHCGKQQFAPPPQSPQGRRPGWFLGQQVPPAETRDGFPPQKKKNLPASGFTVAILPPLKSLLT